MPYSQKMNFFASMIKHVSLLFLWIVFLTSCKPKKEENTKVTTRATAPGAHSSTHTRQS